MRTQNLENRFTSEIVRQMNNQNHDSSILYFFLNFVNMFSLDQQPLLRISKILILHCLALLDEAALQL